MVVKITLKTKLEFIFVANNNVKIVHTIGDFVTILLIVGGFVTMLQTIGDFVIILLYSKRICALTSSDIWLMAIAVELKCNPFALGGHSMKYPFYSEFIEHMKMLFFATFAI